VLRQDERSPRGIAALVLDGIRRGDRWHGGRNGRGPRVRGRHRRRRRDRLTLALQFRPFARTKFWMDSSAGSDQLSAECLPRAARRARTACPAVHGTRALQRQRIGTEGLRFLRAIQSDAVVASTHISALTSND
jgi:hypothetical protein